MDAAASYDEVPYGDHAFAATHPDRLAAIATLHGLHPPPLESCRVLELGCAAGGNLIPMAITLPGAQFTGIDISPRQVARGLHTVEALALKKLQLQTADILEFDAAPGSFDYILCHGVYSWIPPHVQERLLELCRRLLAPTGIAYISYNSLPGWNIRGMLRDMLRFHTRGLPDAASRIQQCQAFLQFLPQAFPDSRQHYASLITHEAQRLIEAPVEYLYHEHLEECNEPLYFTEFVRRIRAAGLEYLAEADVFSGMSRISPEVLEELMNASADLIEFEQYRDFIIARMFRKSLLVHTGSTFSPTPKAERLERLHFLGRARPISASPDVISTASEEFAVAGAGAMKTSHSVMKSALVELASAAPARLSFEELWSRVATQLNVPADHRERARDEMARTLLHCYLSQTVEIHLQPTPFALAPGLKPVASPFARHRAAAGDAKIINLNHREVELGDLERLLLERLDGTRDRSQLRNELLALSAEGMFEITENGAPVDNRDRLAPVLDQWIADGIDHLARTAFFLS